MMEQTPKYIVRARLKDTTILQNYCLTEKEARRSLSCYVAIRECLEAVVLDYMTLEALSHWVKKGVRPVWCKGEYGIF